MAVRIMLDEFSVLTLVTARLEGAGIAYMVTGIWTCGPSALGWSIC